MVAFRTWLRALKTMRDFERSMAEVRRGSLVSEQTMNDMFLAIRRERDKLRADIEEMWAENKQLQERVVELEGLLCENLEPLERCDHWDHHGYCQTHWLEPRDECRVKRAYAALDSSMGEDVADYIREGLRVRDAYRQEEGSCRCHPAEIDGIYEEEGE